MMYISIPNSKIVERAEEEDRILISFDMEQEESTVLFFEDRWSEQDTFMLAIDSKIYHNCSVAIMSYCMDLNSNKVRVAMRYESVTTSEWVQLSEIQQVKFDIDYAEVTCPPDGEPLASYEDTDSMLNFLMYLTVREFPDILKKKELK